MAGYLGNSFCTAPYTKNIWYTCGQESGAKFSGIVVLKCALYFLKTKSNPFHEFIGNFLRCIGFNPSRADQYLWRTKSDEYDGYDYIATHVNDIIIAENNPSKYMN